jgi:exosome complex component RRP43
MATTSVNAEAGPSSAPTQTPAAAATAAAVFKRLHPASYLARYVAEGYRADGRKIGAWRDVSINTGEF